MSATINLVSCDVMSDPSKPQSTLVRAVYEIVAWTYRAAADRESIDFSTGNGQGSAGITLQIAAGPAAVPVRFRFRRVDIANPITLVDATNATAAVGVLYRTGATTFALFVFGNQATGAGIEVADGTNLAAATTAYVSATPSRARFEIIGQLSTDPVDTPLPPF